MGSRAIFVSDLHLTSPDDFKTKVFVEFLRTLLRDSKTQTVSLFLVGDIFDLWVGGHRYFVSRFQNVVDAIGALVKAGVSVHYFEGNHDLHLGRFWRDQVGAEVHTDSGVFRIGRYDVRVEHGDLINPEDKGYLFLRRFLRSGPLKFLSLHLPDRIVKAISTLR